MRYALLICGDENAMLAASPEETAAMMAGYQAFGEEMAHRGVLRGGERLRPTTDATTVRVVDGDVVVSDGPFAETKEQIAGYDIIECADLDEAVEVAAKHPVAKFGAIELRPVWT